MKAVECIGLVQYAYGVYMSTYVCTEYERVYQEYISADINIENINKHIINIK